VVNAYLIAFVAAMPLAGRISDVIGRRRTFVGAYLCFLAGTIVIPLSVTLDEPFGWFVLGRVLSGIGGGAMVPVALAVVGDAYAVGRRARALGTLGAIETMGWVWGPLYGALLVRFLSWEWQFWLNVPLGVVGLAVSWVVLGDHDRPPQRVPVDWLGAALLTVALVSVNVALLGSAEIQSVTGLDELTGGSGPDLRWLGVVAIVAGAAFLAQQARSANPLLDRGLVRGRNLAMALVVNFVVGAGLAIAMVDESAVSDGEPFVHWVISGLDPLEIAIADGDVPPGSLQALNFFGAVGYGGPCPPPADDAHEYRLTAYALGQQLEVFDGDLATDFLDVIELVAIGSADVTGLYQRSVP